MANLAFRPRKGSRKFNKEITKEVWNKVEGTSREELVETGVYDSERWDGTREERVPVYNHRKGRFTIMDPDDITRSKELTKNSDTLHELVAACKLQHEEYHPKHREYITKADIFDQNDPFFTHDDTMFILDSGSAFFDDDNPLNKIMTCVLLTHDDFGVGGATLTNSLNSKVRYLLVDTSIDRRIKKKRRELTKQVNKVLETISDADALKVALALNLISDPSFGDKDIIEEILYDYAHNNVDKVDGVENMTKQEHFLKVVGMGTKILNTSFIFSKALNLGIIKRVDLAYRAFGSILGKERDQAINFLTIPSQAHIYERIEAAIQQLDGGTSLDEGYDSINIEEEEDSNVIDLSNSDSTISIDDDTDEDNTDTKSNKKSK